MPTYQFFNTSARRLRDGAQRSIGFAQLVDVLTIIASLKTFINPEK